jgi:hypothetical protein
MNLQNYYVVFHDPLWILILSLALFFPVRQLIWVLYIRKKQKTSAGVNEEDKKKLKKKSTFTSIFLCVVFSYVYVNQVFN